MYGCFVTVCISFLLLLVMFSEIGAGNFSTLLYGVLLKVGRNVLNMMKTVGKLPRNCKRYLNYPHVFHGPCKHIFWEKTGGFIPYCPSSLYFLM
jgi:hypothetical protein